MATFARAATLRSGSPVPCAAVIGAAPPKAHLAASSTASEAPSDKLWHKLKDALDQSARCRVDCQRGYAQTLLGLDQAFAPHGNDARQKARSFLSEGGRVLAKLQSVVQQLEIQASAAHAAHTAHETNWRRRNHELLEGARAHGEATACVLLHELHRAELEKGDDRDALSTLMQKEVFRVETEYERRARAMEAHFERECSRLVDEVSSLRGLLESTRAELAAAQQAARHDVDRLERAKCDEAERADQLAAQLTKESAALQGERQLVQQLRHASGVLEADHESTRTELERTRLVLHTQIERLARERRALEAEYEGQLTHVRTLHEDEKAHLHATLQKVRDGHRRSIERLAWQRDYEIAADNDAPPLQLAQTAVDAADAAAGDAAAGDAAALPPPFAPAEVGAGLGHGSAEGGRPSRPVPAGSPPRAATAEASAAVRPIRLYAAEDFRAPRPPESARQTPLTRQRSSATLRRASDLGAGSNASGGAGRRLVRASSAATLHVRQVSLRHSELMRSLESPACLGAGRRSPMSSTFSGPVYSPA